nr:gp58-like family protein [Streptococcus suis]
MLAKDRVFAIRAGTYTSSDIKEASFNYGYISGDTFKPGGTVAGSAKLTFTSIITSFNKLDKVYPEIGLKVGDSFEWVAMGEYFVNDINIDRNRNTTELDLMDGMFKLNQPYISDLTYPAQIRDVIREICAKTGVELETDNLGFRAIRHHIQSKADKKDITFREVLSQAIQLLGFSAFFNRKGKLEIRGLTESNITITADNYFLHGLTKSELMYQIAGITCKKDKETLTVGLRTGRSLELENSFMIQNILDDLYYDLKEIKYYPFSLDWQGHLKLDVGQWITLKTNKNETFKVPVLSQSFNFKGGLKSKISADSKAGNDTQYSYKGFLGKRIEQMSTEIEAEVQQQLEYKDKEFDEKINKAKSEINAGLEQSKADAEAYADNIKQQIDGQLAESDRQYQQAQQAQDRQIADVLAKVSLTKDMAEQTVTDLMRVRNAFNQSIGQANTKALELERSIGTVRTDVMSQAQTILAQAQAQTELTSRVASVETTANSTKVTVTELSKTLNKATGDIASVTSWTKTVEDNLRQTRTQYEALTQIVNGHTGQIDSVNQRTSTIEAGLAGVTEKFESLQVGGRNYIRDFGFANLSKVRSNGASWRFEQVEDSVAQSGQCLKATCTTAGGGGLVTDLFDLRGIEWQDKMMTFAVDIKCSKSVRLKYGCEAFENASNQLIDVGTDWKRYSSSRKVQFNRWHHFIFYLQVGQWEVGDVLYIRDPQLEDGTVATTPRAAEEDLRNEIATYKRTAEESSVDLSRQIQLVDGKTVDTKNYAQQIAEGFKTRIESLETFKDSESTRASLYFTASRDETARQVSALRVAVTEGYVDKARYEEDARGITQKFESLQVGGRNLILGTKSFVGSHWVKHETWRLEEDLYKGAGVLTWASGTKASPIAHVPVQAGETYTFSAYIKKANQGTVYFYLYDTHETQFAVANVPRETLIRNVGNTFQRFSITFMVNRSGLLKPRFAIMNSDAGGFSVAGYQLEEGGGVTPYKEAPEDYQHYADAKIAEYKNTVDGRFATIQSSVDNKANLVDFQRVQETARLYERIIGSTETGIKDKVARMVMADSLFLTEVKDKISGTATQVSQLNDSYAIKNLTSAGTVLNQINLLANGTNRIDGRLTHITGQTLIDNGVISAAKIGDLDAGKIKTGTLDAARIKANSIDGSKIAFDEAFFNGMTANQANLKKLFAQSAFITSVQAVAVSAKQIVGGIAKALNGGMDVNFDESKINFYTNVAAIRRIYTGHPTQFIKFETEGNYSRTIIGSNRNGGEVFNSATFAGIVVENTNNINTEDNVRIYGDNTLFRHAQGDVGWNINSVTQRIVPANINAESEIWSKHFVAPDKNSKPVRLDTAVAALWDIWNHIIYNNFEFNEALRTHIKARRDNWKFELNL